MKKTAKLLSFAGSVALLGALSLVGAPAANATPSCNKPFVDATGATITCWGTGQFRLTYVCPKYWAWETTWAISGPWVNAPLSTALNTGTTCNKANNKPYLIVNFR